MTKKLTNKPKENINCGAAAGCSVGYERSISYSIGFSVSATVSSWINGGFDVSKSWTTGNQYTCNGNTRDTVCIWYNTAHTAYTVRNYDYNQCTGSAARGKAVIHSPNAGNRGGGYYCVVGASCINRGSSYWDRNGRAGGP